MRFPEQKDVAWSSDCERPLLKQQESRQQLRRDADDWLGLGDIAPRGNRLVFARLVVLARRSMIAVSARVIMSVVMVMPMTVTTMMSVPIGILTVMERPIAEIARKHMNRSRLMLAELHHPSRREGENEREQCNQ